MKSPMTMMPSNPLHRALDLELDRVGEPGVGRQYRMIVAILLSLLRSFMQ
jgi:hypothetical protein